jgi:hypothetical protein
MLKPFFSYFGSKFTLSKYYPSPVHGRIVELFAGSAAYSCLYPHKRVTLIDTSPDITITWIYLIRAKESEILSLPDIKLGQNVDDLNICPEARLLVGWWCGKGRTVPARSIQDNQWTRKYKLDNKCHYWGKAIRSRIANQLQYIRHWKVICDDWYNHVYMTLPATWFIDPPYEQAGIHYPYNNIDYVSLADACHSVPGQIIACENVEARWLPFRLLKVSKANNSVSGVVRYRNEGVWTSDNC